MGSEEGEMSWSHDRGCRFVDKGWIGEVEVDVGS